MVARGYRDLKVYQLAYSLAMRIFNETTAFPSDGRMLSSMIRDPAKFFPT